MASIKKTVDSQGETVYKITVSNGRGRKVTRSWRPEPTWSARTTERELNKFCADLENQLSTGTVRTHKEAAEEARRKAAETARIRTFRQYAERVWLPQRELSAAPTTVLQSRRLLEKHILPALGDCLMSEITPAQLTAVLNDYQRDHAYSSACVLHSNLKSIFDSAELDGTVALSPMLRVRRPKRPKAEVAVSEGDRAYNAEEAAYILECAEREPLKWRCFINVMLDTGARNGEVFALRWEDIDFRGGTVTISRSLQRTPEKGIYTTSPKNGRSRVVDIGQKTLDILRQWRREQAETCISPFVFNHRGSAEVMSPGSSTEYFRKFGERYNIADFHPHKLRHTSASLAIAAGADVKSVSERLGHSDVGITLKVYTHANEETIRAAGQAVRDVIEQASRAAN